MSAARACVPHAQWHVREFTGAIMRSWSCCVVWWARLVIAVLVAILFSDAYDAVILHRRGVAVTASVASVSEDKWVDSVQVTYATARGQVSGLTLIRSGSSGVRLRGK